MKKKSPENEFIAKAIWILFNVHKTFHSPSGTRPQYLNIQLNPIFAFSTFKNTIPALDRVLYSGESVGTSIGKVLSSFLLKVQTQIYFTKSFLQKSNNIPCKWHFNSQGSRHVEWLFEEIISDTHLIICDHWCNIFAVESWCDSVDVLKEVLAQKWWVWICSFA